MSSALESPRIRRAHDQLLDLLGSFEDVEDLGVTGPLLEQLDVAIADRAGELHEAETEAAASLPVAPILDDYSWLWRDEGLELPIVAEEYYIVETEANGNLSLAHRVNGQLVMFAPDHAFDGVTPLPNCPPYLLMTIDAAPSLEAWIESCAAALV